MCLLDLDEVDDVMALHPLWSTRRGRPVQFRRADYLGDPAMDLKAAVRQRVETTCGPLGHGSIRVLTQLRTWGWCFNPISVYYCGDGDGRLTAAVASVTNTPWGERNDYVLEARGGRVDQLVRKALHVSPFIGMEQAYRFSLSAPAEDLEVRVDVLEGDSVHLATALALTRRALDRSTMTSLLASSPFMGWRVSAAIYWQAGQLWRKGAPFHPHPRRVAEHAQARS